MSESIISKSEFSFPDPMPKKFVAFIDVLGFSELVFKNQNIELESYFKTVSDILAEMKADGDAIESISISDSIILIAPISLQGLKKLIKGVRNIQKKLLFKNILMRGAISLGEVFFDDSRNIIVGKGYIRAYLLEQEAVFPRVIIDPAILKEMETDRVGFLRLTNGEQEQRQSNIIYEHSNDSQIPNDAIFVNYAYTITSEKTISKVIGKVYYNLKKNLYSEQKLYSKYTWLKNYYLEFVKYSEATTPNKLHKSVLKEWITKFERL